MKFVHIADMHFDTSFAQINNSEFGATRRLEQRNALKKVVKYIKENNVDYLFIAGDFYEHKFIKESTIEYINKLFKEIENTKIFITPGNHDPLIKNSFYNKYIWNNNVHIFNSKISYVDDNNVRIYGYGFDDFYYTNSELNTLTLENPEKINILITHGMLNGTNNVDKQYNAITKQNLLRIGFDYVALGHIHKSNYGEEDKIIYPGSTISMGFDELGSHGMIVGEFIGKELKTEFIPLDESEFQIIEVDVSSLGSNEDLADMINSMYLVQSNFYEVYLIGNRRFEIDIYSLKKIINRINIIKIKDRTKLTYNLEELSKGNNLKGLFVKEVMDRLESDQYDKETLERALEIGLGILEK